MGSKAKHMDHRATPRRALTVPFRMVTPGRLSQTIDGETTDVSSKGVGIKFGRGDLPAIEPLMENLVEDRLSVEMTLRFPQGSIRVEGVVMWWGLLGDDDRFALRAGILLGSEWSETDWALIEQHLGAPA